MTEPWSDHPLLAVPLTGTSIIEASAGTGKTWTIVGLYLRLVIEAGLEPRQILAVTFTKAAIAELSSRLRLALTDIAAALAGPDEEGAQGSALVRMLWPLVIAVGRTTAAARVRVALASFDEAAIVTIHSFCQRVLGDAAFESARPFSAQTLVRDEPLWQECAEDAWRSVIAANDRAYLDYLRATGWGPRWLLTEARPLLDARRTQPVLTAATARFDLSAFERAYAAARAMWWGERDAACEQLIAANQIGGVRQLQSARAKLDKYFASPRALTHIESVSIDKSARPALARFVPEYFSKKAEASATSHAPHPFFELARVLLDQIVAATDAYRARASARVEIFARETLEHLRERKAASGELSFDDMVVRVAEALQSTAGAALAARLLGQFGAALVDEFQDTDRWQYQILRDVFVKAARPLTLVGDPKQAIYRFRGADVFTYFAARDNVPPSARFALTENRRSTPDLVRALNAIFAAPNAFVLDQIAFRRAVPQPETAARLVDDGWGVAPPVRLWVANDAVDLQARVIAACANEIARIVAGGAAGRTRLDSREWSRAIGGRDIAVIVGTHFEIESMRAALALRGVAAVTRSKHSVFDSPEVIEIVRILDAIANPVDRGRVKAALVTRAFGYSWRGVLALDDDDAQWQAWVDRFQMLAEHFAHGGLPRAWRDIAIQRQLGGLATSLDDGARVLTNYEHLVELAHGAARARDLGPYALARYLERAVEDSALDMNSPDDDPTLLRLESDADLVQLMTVHQSKGLEFPIVFCPFLGHGTPSRDRKSAPVFHRPGSDVPWLDMGSPSLDIHRVAAQVEDLAERVRLAYVAMSRAQHRLYVCWTPTKKGSDSAPAWLWHRDQTMVEPIASLPALEQKFTPIKSTSKNGAASAAASEAARLQGLRDDLSRLSAASRGAIEVVTLPESSVAATAFPQTARDPDWVACTFERGRLPLRLVSSFSAIVNAAHDESADRDARGMPDDVEVALEEGAENDSRGGVDELPVTPLPSGLPRGAQTGTALHRLFELVDFQRSTAQDVADLASGVLPSFGLPRAAANEAASWVIATLEARLGPDGSRLRDIEPGRRLVEMEFTLPLASVARGRLAAIVTKHRAARGLPPLGSGELDRALVPGYMKGYIDLIFERDGRYFIVDYKTNDLGVTAKHYASDHLAVAVAKGLYDLQYLLYCVALRRMLAWRVKGRKRHVIGGVYYLFVRGISMNASMSAFMNAATTADQQSRGIYFAAPDPELLDELDALFVAERVT